MPTPSNILASDPTADLAVAEPDFLIKGFRDTVPITAADLNWILTHPSGRGFLFQTDGLGADMEFSFDAETGILTYETLTGADAGRKWTAGPTGLFTFTDDWQFGGNDVLFKAIRYDYGTTRRQFPVSFPLGVPDRSFDSAAWAPEQFGRFVLATGGTLTAETGWSSYYLNGKLGHNWDTLLGATAGGQTVRLVSGSFSVVENQGLGFDADLNLKIVRIAKSGSYGNFPDNSATVVAEVDTSSVTDGGGGEVRGTVSLAAAGAFSLPHTMDPDYRYALVVENTDEETTTTNSKSIEDFMLIFDTTGVE
jgi:hypothetical protein